MDCLASPKSLCVLEYLWRILIQQFFNVHFFFARRGVISLYDLWGNFREKISPLAGRCPMVNGLAMLMHARCNIQKKYRTGTCEWCE
jgi:hypothetical protein